MRTGESRACALARAPLSRPAVAHAASPSLSLSHTSLLVVCSLTRAALATRFINPEGLDAIEGVFPASARSVAGAAATTRRILRALALAGGLLLSNPPQSDKSYPHVGSGNAAGNKPSSSKHRTQLATPAPRQRVEDGCVRLAPHASMREARPHHHAGRMPPPPPLPPLKRRSLRPLLRILPKPVPAHTRAPLTRALPCRDRIVQVKRSATHESSGRSVLSDVASAKFGLLWLMIVSWRPGSTSCRRTRRTASSRRHSTRCLPFARWLARRHLWKRSGARCRAAPCRPS